MITVDKFLLWKAYFEEGMGKTHYLFYFIALFGIASSDVKTTLLIGVIFAIFSFIVGRLWFTKKLKEKEMEIQNRINPFVREMRRKIK